MAQAPDPAEARRRYAEIAPTYARRIDQRFVKRMRSIAVARLELQPGDHVLDVGCGTGASFPYLVGAVGPDGRVTGIELTEEMAAIARSTVADARWDNAEVVVGEAATAPLPPEVDGVLFFLTHDLVRSPDVVERVVAVCRPGAHIVAFGPKMAPRWTWPLNTIVRQFTKRYVTTFEGFDRPWSHLETHLPDFTVRTLALGAVYLGQGTVPAGESAH